MALPPGRFHTYGIAVNPTTNRIGMLLVTREKFVGTPGSKFISQEWTGQEWPNTARGNSAAMEESGRLNCAMYAHLAPE